ncbi:MAG: GAF domain-containing protein, partial [Chloroflexi bacterium]|nr:GAF domain-containing protein [Chloroflexota bacterium]
LSVLISRSALTNALKNSLAAEAALRAEGIRSYLLWTRSMAVDISAVAEALELDEESSKQVIARMLADNEQIIGSTIAYEPYQFKPEMEFWAPYYNRTPDSDELIFTQLGTPENNYPAQDWYRLAKEANDIILSPPYFDIGGAKIWMVTWSVPFHNRAGELKGVATTDISFSQTQEVVRQIAVGKQGYAFLVDKDGVVLGIGDQGGQYRIMEESIRLEGESEQAVLWNALIGEMTQGKSGFADLVDPQGRAVFIAYEPIGMETGWSLALAYPQRELFEPAVQLQNNLIFFSLVALFVASAALFTLSRSITRPLQEMTAWAKAFSEGRIRLTSQSVRGLSIHTNDEIEDLANAFNQMSSELSATLTTLEERVADRTKALATSSEVSRRLAAILDKGELAKEVVNQVKEAFGYYHVQIYFFDESGENLVMAGGAGEVGEKTLAQSHKLPKGRGLVGRAAETNKPVLVSDTEENRRLQRRRELFLNEPVSALEADTPIWTPNVLLPETKSEAAIPISFRDKVIGVLDVQHNVVDGLKREDIDALQSIANQIAIAAQNAQSYAEVQRSQALLSDALKAARLGNWEYDYKKDLFTFNDDFYAIFRTTAQEVGGYQMSSAEYARRFVHPDDAALVGSEIQKVLNAKDRRFSTHLEHRIVFPDGETGYIAVNINVERDENGNITRWYGVNQDITERRRMEEFARKRAAQQEALNRITQQIQNAASIEDALKVAARELGHALGMKPTVAALEADSNNGSHRGE